MANTVQDNNRLRWKYTDDKAREWAISAKKVYTDQAKQGGSAAAASVRRIPRDLKPRMVKMTSAGLPDRWMIAYTTAALIYATPGTTMTLNNNGVDATYTATDIVRGESYRDTTQETA